MAGESSVVTTGLREAFAAVEKLPDAVTAALRGVAERTGTKVQGSSREELLSKTNATKTAAAIKVVVDAPNQTVSVISPGDKADPANLSIWFEHGTIRMPPKPFMGPGARRHQAAYVTESVAAAEGAAQKLIGS